MAIDLDEVWPAIADRLGPAIVGTREYPEEQASECDLPAVGTGFASAVRDALQAAIGEGKSLYAHQAEAIRAALKGHDVVLQTPTASGKSVCYWTPALQRVLEEPASRVIYVAPLNALVRDQLGAVARFSGHSRDDGLVCGVELGGRRITVARYDGSLTNEERRVVRRQKPDILVANPDILHHGVLRHHDLWQGLFDNLRLLIIDEMHLYRGMFGASMSGLIRRVLRLTPDRGRQVQFICCSATIGNAPRLFTALTGRHEPVVVAKSGAQRYRRRLVVVDPLRAGSSVTEMAGELIAMLVGARRVPTIAFTRSIPEVDRVYRQAMGTLARRPGMSDIPLYEYKRLIPDQDKERITTHLRDGEALGVVATSALQAGIDIGALSAAVIVRFPQARADFLQQMGRVGRQGPNVTLLLVGESAVDRYYASRPEELLDEQLVKPESVFLNENNRVILARQLLCAAREHPLRAPGDIKAFGPSTRRTVADLIENGLLRRVGDGYVAPTERGLHEAGRVQMRTPGFDLRMLDQAGKEIAKPDALQAMRRFHVNGRFQVQDRHYVVMALELDWARSQGIGRVTEVEPPHFATQAPLDVSIAVLSAEGQRTQGPLEVHRGNVRLTLRVTRYRELYQGRRPGDYVPLGDLAPPPRQVETEALWFDLASLGGEWSTSLAAGNSLAGALRLAGALLCSTDAGDHAHHIETNPGTGMRIFVADVTPGGDGISRELFERWQDLIDAAMRLLGTCPNCTKNLASTGCPSCVAPQFGGAETVDRSGAIKLLQTLGAAPLPEAGVDAPSIEADRLAGESRVSAEQVTPVDSGHWTEEAYEDDLQPDQWDFSDDAWREAARDRAFDTPLFGIDENGDLVPLEDEPDEIERIQDPRGFPGFDA